jgi:hypothetical protein
MADNVAITAGAGTTVATDDIGGVHHQRVKMGWGADGSYGDVSAAAPLPVTHAAGLGSKALSAAFATLTRPANVTAYTAGDSISNDALAASVTALVSGNFSDTNDAPVYLEHIEIKSTDTGLNGKTIRARIFRSDPTAATGVGAGDNAAYSNKQAGLVASFIGTMQSGISDGAAGTLVLANGNPRLLAYPATGARTFWIQYESVDGFTPSANSTTIIGTLYGTQVKAT